jgi:hypothetical protein
MLTRVANLLFALLLALASVYGMANEGSRWDFMSFVLSFITFCWLASALGLFFRKRLAWYGSLLGVGTMVAGSVTLLVVGIALIPTSQDPTEGAGMATIVGVFGLLIFVPVLVGLLRLRRKWFLPASPLPNEALQATAAPPRCRPLYEI